MGLMKGNENMASKHVLNCAPFMSVFENKLERQR